MKKGQIEYLTDIFVGTIILIIFGSILFTSLASQKDDQRAEAEKISGNVHVGISFLNVLNSEFKGQKIWQIIQDSDSLDNELKEYISENILNVDECMTINGASYSFEKIYAPKDTEAYCPTIYSINIQNKNDKTITVLFGNQVEIREK